MKIVINSDYGGFSLSEQALALYKELGGNDLGNMYSWDIFRNDPVLVEVVEALGSNADGESASLRIVEIPDDVLWTIQEYDGLEWIAERHRTWS